MSVAAPPASALLRDFGGMRAATPARTYHPRTTDEARDALQAAASLGLEVSVRGLGHSCNGHTLSDGGAVLDLSGLSGVEHVGDGWCDVLPGTPWEQVIAATLPTGQVPPALPDYLGLSVGGTISIGGLGGTSFREGLIAAQLLEADILMADGSVQGCSAVQNPQLLACARGGGGQFGAILRARLRLVPAPLHVDVVRLVYADGAAMLADQQRLLAQPGLWHLGGWVLPLPQGWTPCIELAYPADGPDPAAAAQIFAPGAGVIAPATQVARMPLVDFLHRLEANPAFPCPRGTHAHPWLTAFLPAEKAPAFLAEMLHAFPAQEMGPAGVMEVYPVPAARFHPGAEGGTLPPVLFMISAFPCQLDISAPALEAALARNRRLLDLALDLGGLGDPQASAIAFSPHDWQRQLGPHLQGLLAARAHFDPATRFKSLAGLGAIQSLAAATPLHPLPGDLS